MKELMLIVFLLGALPDKIDELAAANRFDEALVACAEAEKAAIKAKDADSVMRCREKKRELTLLKRAYDKVKDADAKLVADPNDAAACDTMGRFYLFVKGDWNRGMPLLEKSHDAFLKALAEKEVAAKTNTDAKLAAADAWWAGSAEIEAKGILTGATATASVKADKDLVARARSKMTERAIYWYEQAWGALRPEEKAKVRLRFKQFYANPQATPPKAGDMANWVQMGAPFGKAETSDLYAKDGRRSVRIVPSKTSKATWVALEQKWVRVTPLTKYEFSFWVLADGLQGGALTVSACYIVNGQLNTLPVGVATDEPFWRKYTVDFTAPEGCDTVMPQIVMAGQKGEVFLDCVSLRSKEDSREYVQNGSFER